MRNSIIVLLGIIVVSCGDAVNTAYKEFKPSALLNKYEYYKDVSASLDKKVADIGVYESRIKDLKEQYRGLARKDWPRDDREQLSVWQSELSGIKASYNTLASEYNAAMSKFNYKFCNIGDLPKGAEIPLPKEFKPYISN